MLKTLEMHKGAGTPANQARREQIWCAALLPPAVGLLVIDVEIMGNNKIYIQTMVCPASLPSATQFAATDATIYHMHCVPPMRLDGTGRDQPFAIDAVASGTLPGQEGGPVLLLRDAEGCWLFSGQRVDAVDIHELTILFDVAPLDERCPAAKLAAGSSGMADSVGRTTIDA